MANRQLITSTRFLQVFIGATIGLVFAYQWSSPARQHAKRCRTWAGEADGVARTAERLVPANDRSTATLLQLDRQISTLSDERDWVPDPSRGGVDYLGRALQGLRTTIVVDHDPDRDAGRETAAQRLAEAAELLGDACIEHAGRAEATE